MSLLLRSVVQRGRYHTGPLPFILTGPRQADQDIHWRSREAESNAFWLGIGRWYWTPDGDHHATVARPVSE